MNLEAVVAVRRATLQIQIDYPQDHAEVLRRRMIALIAAAGHTISSAASAAGLHHNIVVRKLASPDRPASERRPLDEATIVALLGAIARAPSALVDLDIALGDELVLQWLAQGRASARKTGSWLSAKKHSETIADACARWPDAAARIDRLARAGFVVEDGVSLSITPTGSACAVR